MCPPRASSTVWTESGKDKLPLRPQPDLLHMALSARKGEQDQPRPSLVSHGAQGTKGEARAPLHGPIGGLLLPTSWNQEAQKRHQDWACRTSRAALPTDLQF